MVKLQPGVVLEIGSNLGSDLWEQFDADSEGPFIPRI
jgi:hypothetical protein